MLAGLAVWAVTQPFVVTRAWAGVLAAVILAGLAALAHVTVTSSTPAPAETQLDAPTPAKAQRARRRRGVKALIIGSDGRASTSKTQVVLWTFAIFYALVFLLLWGRSVGCASTDLDDTPACEQAMVGRDAFLAVTNGALQHEYYALLGLPVAAAVAAKAITTNKEADGELVKDDIDPGQGGFRDSLSEIISNDAGETDLIDFQYFAFTLLALAFFLTEFFANPGAGLPNLPPTLVALSGVSTGAYTAKKSLAKDDPAEIAKKKKLAKAKSAATAQDNPGQ